MPFLFWVAAAQGDVAHTESSGQGNLGAWFMSPQKFPEFYNLNFYIELPFKTDTHYLTARQHPYPLTRFQLPKFINL